MSVNVALVVLAGGSGIRAGGSDNKVYRSLAGRPLLSFSIEAAAAAKIVDRLVVVTRPEDRSRAEQVVRDHAHGLRTTVVVGGATRHQSERNALAELADDIENGSIGVVGIHDGARPFLNPDLLRSLIAAATECGGAIPGLPLEGVVANQHGDLVDTNTLRRVQTPQVFQARPLLEAYRHAAQESFEGIDTAETVIRYSEIELRLIVGDPFNIKVTYAKDFETAEESSRLRDSSPRKDTTAAK